MTSHSNGDDIPEEQDVAGRADSKDRSSHAEGNGGDGSNFLKDEPIVSRRELWSYYRSFNFSFITTTQLKFHFSKFITTAITYAKPFYFISPPIQYTCS
jgi:hypothetical protein